MYAMPMPNFRLATPEEVMELDHENRMIQQQFAKVLDEVDADPGRFLRAALAWLDMETGHLQKPETAAELQQLLAPYLPQPPAAEATSPEPVCMEACAASPDVIDLTASDEPAEQPFDEQQAEHVDELLTPRHVEELMQLDSHDSEEVQQPVPMGTAQHEGGDESSGAEAAQEPGLKPYTWGPLPSEQAPCDPVAVQEASPTAE